MNNSNNLFKLASFQEKQCTKEKKIFVISAKRQLPAIPKYTKNKCEIRTFSWLENWRNWQNIIRKSTLKAQIKAKSVNNDKCSCFYGNKKKKWHKRKSDTLTNVENI